MQMSLFPEFKPVERREHRPLVKQGDLTYRFELRFLWCPEAGRGQAAAEVTDDESSELFYWELRPGAESVEELLQEVRKATESLAEQLRYYDEPF